MSDTSPLGNLLRSAKAGRGGRPLTCCGLGDNAVIVRWGDVECGGVVAPSITRCRSSPSCRSSSSICANSSSATAASASKRFALAFASAMRFLEDEVEDADDEMFDDDGGAEAAAAPRSIP